VFIYHIDFTINSDGVPSEANFHDIFDIDDSATSTADIPLFDIKLFANNVFRNSVIAFEFKNHP
jgi:hypothetical protein